MLFIQMLAFLLIITGGFIILEIEPFNFYKELVKKFKKEEKDTLKKRIFDSKKVKKVFFIKKIINETEELLIISGKSQLFPKICMLSLILFIVGILIGAMTTNFLLIPIFAFVLSMLPFYYVRIEANRYKKMINNQLSYALNQITTTYVNERIVLVNAVEKNLKYIKAPLNKIFSDFVISVNHINPNIKENIEYLKTKINNAIFEEWCDTLITCQDNQNLKALLPEIMSKFTNMKVVNTELETIMYEPIRNFFILVILEFILPIIFYLLNKSWYEVLFSNIGKIILAGCLITTIFFSIKVIKLAKPLEYRR